MYRGCVIPHPYSMNSTTAGCVTVKYPHGCLGDSPLSNFKEIPHIQGYHSGWEIKFTSVLGPQPSQQCLTEIYDPSTMVHHELFSPELGPRFCCCVPTLRLVAALYLKVKLRIHFHNHAYRTTSLPLPLAPISYVYVSITLLATDTWKS